jgi:hypothetical protein
MKPWRKRRLFADSRRHSTNGSVRPSGPYRIQSRTRQKVGGLRRRHASSTDFESFSDRPILESELSKLLYFTWGMTARVENTLGDVFIRKTSPSGGSLHPIEVYPIVLNVDGVPRLLPLFGPAARSRGGVA